MKAKILLALAAFCCQNAISSEMIGNFNANDSDVKWQGVKQSTNWMPSYWDVAMRLPAANKFIFDSASIHSGVPTLTNADQSLPFSVNVAGVEFLLPKDAKNCDTNSSESSALGLNNISNTSYCFSSTQSPFTHFRPILNLSGNNWNSSFKDNSGGTYSSRFNVQMVYFFYRDGVKVKHHVLFPVLLKIDYYPSKRIKLTVSGNDEMFSYIDPVNKGRIYGETTYQLEALYDSKAREKVDTDLSLKLMDSAGTFHLKNTEVPNSTIPFSVFCSACIGVQTLIDNGKGYGQNDQQITVPNSFSLKVNFESLDFDNLADGTYQGSFRLVFQLATL